MTKSKKIRNGPDLEKHIRKMLTPALTDWDRYYSDDDYADGVDEAMDELDW